MSQTYVITVVPNLFAEGPSKGNLESLTFIASHGNDKHRWLAVNDGELVDDFSRLVGSSAEEIVGCLRRGQTVTLPRCFTVEEIKHNIPPQC